MYASTPTGLGRVCWKYESTAHFIVEYTGGEEEWRGYPFKLKLPEEDYPTRSGRKVWSRQAQLRLKGLGPKLRIYYEFYQERILRARGCKISKGLIEKFTCVVKQVGILLLMSGIPAGMGEESQRGYKYHKRSQKSLTLLFQSDQAILVALILKEKTKIKRMDVHMFHLKLNRFFKSKKEVKRSYGVYCVHFDTVRFEVRKWIGKK